MGFGVVKPAFLFQFLNAVYVVHKTVRYAPEYVHSAQFNPIDIHKIKQTLVGSRFAMGSDRGCGSIL